MVEKFTSFFGEQAVHATFAAGIWISLCSTAGTILHDDRKALLARWLKGDFDDPIAGISWINHFINAFESVFGNRPFSFKFLLRSATVSILFVVALYLLFFTTGKLDPIDGRAGELTLIQMVIFGATINIFADYVSLIETRWILNRFKSKIKIRQHLILLFTDLVLTALIIYSTIWAFTTVTNRPTIHPFELISAFSPFSIFFYSTFLTSFWTWAYCITVWFMRFFCRTPLRRNWLAVDKRPVFLVGMFGSILTFLIVLPLSMLLTPETGSRITNWDQITCEWFTERTCDDLIRISDKEADLDISCKLRPEICAKQAIELHDGDKPKVAHLYTSLCDLGVLNACTNVAWQYHFGEGVSKNVVKAKELYINSCEGDDFRACLSLGVLYEEGVGVPKYLETAEILYEQACDGGFLPGCTRLGSIYEKEKDSANNVENAQILYRKACDGGEMRGCVFLGILSMESDETTVAKELYQRACDGGDLSGCTRLGRLHNEDGEITTAIQLFQRACDGGDLSGCTEVGYSYVFGAGVPKNIETGVKLLKSTCDGGHMLGCTHLGFLYVIGEGVEHNYEYAQQLFRRACNEDGVEIACAVSKVQSAN